MKYEFILVAQQSAKKNRADRQLQVMDEAEDLDANGRAIFSFVGDERYIVTIDIVDPHAARIHFEHLGIVVIQFTRVFDGYKWHRNDQPRKRRDRRGARHRRRHAAE